MTKKHLHIGTMYSYQVYANALLTENVTQEKNYGTPPTTIGQHASRSALHTTSLSESIFPAAEDGDEEDTEETMDAI